MGKVINFELFKGEKELDKDYDKFLANAEKIFAPKTDPATMFKRIYYTLRYLESHLRAINTLNQLGVPILLDKRGKEIIVDWMKDILSKMEETECR